MSNTLAINGGQPQKATRFAPIYTGRWSSGLWTNRSPLRDANTSRISEKFYGAAGDALIAGQNAEITNRLTLARRPGNPLFDANSYTNVDRFDEFRLFNSSSEQIDVMVDQADSLFALNAGVKTLVWNKSPNSGPSYFQSVGNSMYFGNGVDNKKWLQSLNVWASGSQWGTATNPFLDTFLIDPNGNIQQLTAAVFSVIDVQVASDVLTITSGSVLTSVLSVGLEITFPSGMAAAFLDNKTVTVTAVSGSTFTAEFFNPDYALTSETGISATVVAGGTPISGTVQPVWSTVLPTALNNFAGGITVDGTVQWTNRGSTVENWGIVAPTVAPAPAIGSSRSAWKKQTFYSQPGVIIDSNGNLQRVQTAGTSGSVAPTWATGVGVTTTDNSVTWVMLQTAASLVWQPHTVYAPGTFVIGSAGGENCLFEGAALFQPSIVGNVTANLWSSPHSGPVGAFIKTFPATAPELTATGNSFLLDINSDVTAQPAKWETLNAAGEVIGNTVPFPSRVNNYQIAFFATINVPVAGQYTFTIAHHDGMIFGVGGGATAVSGPTTNTIGQTQTAQNGYPIMGANNVSGSNTDTIVVNFPAAGNYGIELDYDFWYHSGQTMSLTINSANLAPGTPESGTTQPVWPAWSTSYAPAYPSVADGSSFKWNNMGPAADFVWSAKTGFTLPNTTIVDPNSNQQAPYRTGVTGTKIPAFSTLLNQLTNDNPNLIWINQGGASAPGVGTISTFNGGWQYAIALVNTLDNTVSNCGPLSTSTGNFIGATGISFAPGEGLPDPSQIDPQCDYVAIFRTTDGASTPFLIVGSTTNSFYTVPLSTYLANGYTDTTPDTELDNEVLGAIAGENTPPLAGAINLTYHLNRIFFSVGNVVYWTSGPDTPVGNGVNGVAPLNFDTLPSLVKRIVPLSIGALVFTVSDIFLIQGQGTANNPIQNAQPFLQGVGILSYDALDINGSIIGLFTTDKQFIILDPSSGVSYAGFPIGDQFRKNNGQPGTSWDASKVYVTWHVDGEDQAWYVADGKFGWYRLMPTPAPESGYTWSPFANIVGGCKAVKSIEVLPGTHKLLLGPTATGSLLNRDLTASQDNNESYTAYAVIGSAVLVQPGQVATVSFITTESVKIGTPLVLGVLFDEALPYYNGPFDLLKEWENDPPGLKPSRSILGQRFYMNEAKEEAVCRHMQIQINWTSENVQNELLSMTVFGAFFQEN